MRHATWEFFRPLLSLLPPFHQLASPHPNPATPRSALHPSLRPQPILCPSPLARPLARPQPPLPPLAHARTPPSLALRPHPHPSLRLSPLTPLPCFAPSLPLPPGFLAAKHLTTLSPSPSSLPHASPTKPLPTPSRRTQAASSRFLAGCGTHGYARARRPPKSSQLIRRKWAPTSGMRL